MENNIGWMVFFSFLFSSFLLMFKDVSMCEWVLVCMNNGVAEENSISCPQKCPLAYSKCQSEKFPRSNELFINRNPSIYDICLALENNSDWHQKTFKLFLGKMKETYFQRKSNPQNVGLECVNEHIWEASGWIISKEKITLFICL